jgi:hypothetical protein
MMRAPLLRRREMRRAVEPVDSPIPATNRETLARLLPQTAKPKPFAAKYA